MSEIEKTSLTLLRKVADPSDEAAWKRFVDRYRPVILTAGRKAGLDENLADEISSDVLAVLVKVMPSFQYDPSKGRFQAYLNTVVRNRIRDLWRNKANAKERAAGGTIAAELLNQVPNSSKLDSVLDTVVEEVEGALTRDAEHLRIAIECVKRKAPKSWEVFERREINQQDYGEIATDLKMKRAAVHVAANRAKKMIREQIEQLRLADENKQS